MAAEYLQQAYEFALNHQDRILVSSILGSLVLAGWLWRKANKDLPPGPRFMMLGNFFSPKTEEEVIQNVVKLREQYGEVVSTRVGSYVFVFLNSYDAIKEAHVEKGNCIAGRPQFKFGTRMDDPSTPGLLNADGPIWQEHRRFVLSSLRNLGFGKNTTESMIIEELQHLCKHIDEARQGGKKAVELSTPFSEASINVICSLVFGERCGAEKDFEQVLKLIHKNRESNNFRFFMLLIVKLIAKVPGDLFGLKRALGTLFQLFDYGEKKINEHRQRHVEGNDNDLIDAYLTAQAQQERERPGKHTFLDFQLTRIVFELFFAGSDTTSTMLGWMFYLIAKRPDLQAKVQQELDEVVGQRTPSTSDRSRLKFTDAVICEMFRYAAILPLGTPMHRVLNEVYVRGYRLPKEAWVFTNLYTVFRDPKLWPYPNEFNPANVFDEQTKTLRNLEHLIPFMIGKRACPGEALARQELFLFFTGLLQRYKFAIDDSYVPTEKGPVNMMFRYAPPCGLTITDRERA